MVAGDGTRPGKIASLAAFLDEHAQAVEADLQRFFAVDLRDLFTGSLSWRRLDVLIAHLPLESATQTARLNAMTDEDLDAALEAHGERHGPWSHSDLLLASIADGVERLIHVQLRRAGVKNAQMPKPIPRPGIRERATVRAINPAAQAYLERLREAHRKEA